MKTRQDERQGVVLQGNDMPRSSRPEIEDKKIYDNTNYQKLTKKTVFLGEDDE